MQTSIPLDHGGGTPPLWADIHALQFTTPKRKPHQSNEHRHRTGSPVSQGGH